jgi:putative phosphoesterase
MRVRVGLISDTHGLLRPEAVSALANVELILHAGDVGGSAVLAGLRAIAPVEAVWGNVDDPAQPGLAASVDVEIGGLRIHVSHGHELGSPTPAKLLARYDADVIVYGHTHKALIHRDAGRRLVVNPGAAGPRRFNLRPSVGILLVSDGSATAQIVEI